MAKKDPKTDPTKASYWVGKSFVLENPLEFVETVSEWKKSISEDTEEEANYDAFIATILETNTSGLQVRISVDSLDLDNDNDVHDSYFTISCGFDEINGVSLHDRDYNMDFGYNMYSRLHKEIWDTIAEHWDSSNHERPILAYKLHKPIPHISSPEEIEAEWNRDKDYIEAMEEAKDDEFKPTYRELNNGGKSILVDYYSSDNIIVHSKDYNKLELIGILYQAIQKLSNEQEQ